MERGTLCPIRHGPTGAYFNHQSWEQGHNRVRYVPASQVAALREAMAEHDRFMTLVRSYTEQVIQQTRRRLVPKQGGAGPTPRPG